MCGRRINQIREHLPGFFHDQQTSPCQYPKSYSQEGGRGQFPQLFRHLVTYPRPLGHAVSGAGPPRRVNKHLINYSRQFDELSNSPSFLPNPTLIRSSTFPGTAPECSEKSCGYFLCNHRTVFLIIIGLNRKCTSLMISLFRRLVRPIKFVRVPENSKLKCHFCPLTDFLPINKFPSVVLFILPVAISH